MSNRPVAIDLFSGCGGMSLGLEDAGFDIAAAVEIDPIHSLVHHYNFPYGVTICRDISQLSSQELLTAIANKGFKTDIDLIAGGPPCQGYSYMGERVLEDPRNQLIFEYARIVSTIKPKYFIFENVPGIASGKHQKFLRELIATFKQNNYSIVEPIKVLDASLYGAPQKRKRLIIIGYRNDVSPPNYPAPTYGQDENLLPLTTVSSAISDLSTIPIFVGNDCGINTDKLDYSEFRKSFNIQPQGEYNLCHIRQKKNIVWGHLGSNHTNKTIKRFSQTIPGTKEPISRFFKLAADGLSHTLRAGTARNKGAFTAPRPIHYLQPRCISIREAARIHTFADWFQFHRTIWHGFREIGNAVVPILAKSLGTEIINCLKINLSNLEIRQLDLVDDAILSYNMKQAAEFWQVPHDIIPKRKRVKA
ncbi:MAG: DNA cytosine methyltransferase [Xenococcus sp. (in: cyanobacteria)]